MDASEPGFKISTTPNAAGSGFHVKGTVLARNVFHTITAVHYAPSPASSKIYVNGVLAKSHSFSSPFYTQIRAMNECYIGKSRYTVDMYYPGRMKFLATYDRALSAAEILAQHTYQAPIDYGANVTLTLSFALSSGVQFKRVSITGLRFNHLDSTSAALARCSNLNVANVVVTPSFTAPSGPLQLTLSTSAAAAVAGSDIICRIPGFCECG